MRISSVFQAAEAVMPAIATAKPAWARVMP
jgi:hypothetical protein